MKYKTVRGYEGIYSIREDGFVYSEFRRELSRNKFGSMVRSRGEHELKSFVGNSGYMMVELNNKNKAKKFYLHRLVYQAFVGELKKGHLVHHLDHNKHNNHHTNLVQITYKEHKVHHPQVPWNKGIKTGKRVKHD